jgi:hypothetical protein
MSPQTARCYIAALACVARIEAMKALNAYREQRGEAQAYDESQFFYESNELSRLADEVIQQ